jgi:hypothetical protein
VPVSDTPEIEEETFRALVPTQRHAVSSAGMVDRGTPQDPGEIGLEHIRAVFLLDVLPGFHCRPLEVLGQPKGTVATTRA